MKTFAAYLAALAFVTVVLLGSAIIAGTWLAIVLDQVDRLR